MHDEKGMERFIDGLCFYFDCQDTIVLDLARSQRIAEKFSLSAAPVLRIDSPAIAMLNEIEEYLTHKASGSSPVTKQRRLHLFVTGKGWRFNLGSSSTSGI